MKIATWNINSVRLRQGQVVQFLHQHQPDVLCLQETKTPDEFFPSAVFAEAGYPHQAFRGMKSYNGVATLSRLPLSEVGGRDWVNKTDCRHQSVTVGGIELHNFYIPAGGDVANVDENEKFAHKLGFVIEITDWFTDHRRSDQAIVMVGDFNIAPLEHDVFNHKYMSKIVSHTPIEIAHLDRLKASLDWCDTMRHFVASDQKLYSWWSYRARNWRVDDRGLRLDHLWVTPPLVPKLQHGEILRDMRGIETPSDHVPVVVTLAL